jgi:uncharacterized protein YaaR (DUF327 family)
MLFYFLLFDPLRYYRTTIYKILKAIDEKYSHELTTDLFKMDFEDININDFSNYQVKEQIYLKWILRI